MIALQPGVYARVRLVIGHIAHHLVGHLHHQLVYLQFAAAALHHQLHDREVQELCFRGGAQQGRMQIIVRKELRMLITFL